MGKTAGKMAEIIGGLIALVMALLWLVMSFSLDQNNIGGSLGLGPGFFPRLISCIMIILCVPYFLQIYRSKNRDVKIQISKIAFLMIVVCILYVLLLNVIGYVITTFLYVMVSIYILGGKSSLSDVIAALIIVATLYGVFRLVLLVPLPSGIFI